MFLSNLSKKSINIFGIHFSLVCSVISLILGALIGCSLICGCSKCTLKEGLDNIGASINYNMSNGIIGNTFGKKEKNIGQNLQSNTGPNLPLPPGELFFFKDTEFKPECCVPMYSGYSSADGCACVSQEQVDYINLRGGNRSKCGDGDY
jgi:hypothetical protein